MSRFNGEFSFVETLRHLIMAMDKWFTAPILGEGFHAIGLPNSGSVDFPWPGLDYDVTPSVSGGSGGAPIARRGRTFWRP